MGTAAIAAQHRPGSDGEVSHRPVVDALGVAGILAAGSIGPGSHTP